MKEVGNKSKDESPKMTFDIKDQQTKITKCKLPKSKDHRLKIRHQWAPYQKSKI